MIEHIWTLPCRMSLVDRETNNVSLIQIFEEIRVPLLLMRPGEQGFFPAVFDIVSLWNRQQADQPVTGFGRVVLTSPTGEELLTNEYEINLRETTRFRFVSRVFGFPGREEGRYHFRIEWRTREEDPWQVAGNVPLWISVLREEESPVAQRQDA